MELQRTPEELHNGLPEPAEIAVGSLDAEKTLLLVVDMINGFAKKGALASDRIGALIPAVVALSKACDAHGIRKIAFGDRHSPASAEFATFPSHCLGGTEESLPVEELDKVGGFTRIDKNSANGFLEEAFQRLLTEHPSYDTFILAGDCTDICILQLALPLKAHFNRINRRSRVIVPRNAVDTYDGPGHDADFMNRAAFSILKCNGIEITDQMN